MAHPSYDLDRTLGPDVLTLLADPAVENVRVGRGLVAVNARGEWREAGVALDAKTRDRAIAYAATAVGKAVTEDHARLLCGLDLPGVARVRLVAHVPPLVREPVLFFRRHAANPFSLSDWRAGGRGSRAGAGERALVSGDVAKLFQLLPAMVGRTNVLVAGRSGCGKSAFMRALLQSPALAEKRVLVVEYAEELPIPEGRPFWDHYLTHPSGQTSDELALLIADAMRLAPDLLVVGEVVGPEALQLVVAMNTGVPVLTSLHADGALDAPRALAERVAMNAERRLPEESIRRNVGAVVFLDVIDGHRAVADIAVASPVGSGRMSTDGRSQ